MKRGTAMVLASLLAAAISAPAQGLESPLQRQVAGLGDAVADLVESQGNRYPNGPGHLIRAREMMAAARAGRFDSNAFVALQHEALTANPRVSAHPVLLVVHAPDDMGTHEYMRPSGYGKKGSALKLLDPVSGRTRTLVSASQGIIRRPDAHFEGRRVVFSMSKDPGDSFHIYEIEVDPAHPFAGGEVPAKQLTRAPDVSDVDPIYLPDDSIAFASTRDLKYVPCDTMIVPQLFRMESDGANIHQITRSTTHENEISLMPDGRILYSRWDYVDRNFGDGHGVWVANPDGCNQAIVWGNNTAHPAAAWTSRLIPGTSRLLCIIGTHHGSLGGALAIIDPRIAIDGHETILRTWPAENIQRFADQEPLNLDNAADHSDVMQAARTWPAEIRALVPHDANMRLYRHLDSQRNVEPWYNSPYPLNDKCFLCVRAPRWNAPPAVYLVDTFGNEVKLYEEAPGCFDPIPLVPRARPPVIASQRDYQNGNGVFRIQNVYEGTHMKGVAPGAVKSIRVIEVLSKRGLTGGQWRGLGAQSPALNWTDFNAKRILGTAPVEPDGSAAFYCPSDRFLYFQLLDKDGMMLQSMRSGTSLHSGEKMGCIGCHESRDRAGNASACGAGVSPARTMDHESRDRTGNASVGDNQAAALKREPSTLQPWYGPERAFSYAVEVQPVFDKHCLSCHDFGKKGARKLILAGDKDFAFNASYGELWCKGYVGALGAGPAAHLPAQSWGARTSPLIKTLRGGHHKVKLDQESMDRVITWVDLNGPYYPTTYAARPGPGPGRNPLTDDQTRRLVELTRMNADSLNTASRYDGPKVSFDRPELSPCLKGLATNSTAYAEALGLIRSGQKSLQALPRADMSGFVPCEIDRKRQAHSEKYQAVERDARQAIREKRKIMDSNTATPETSGL